MSKTHDLLSFFKINDPYRLVAIFLLLLLLRLPFLISPVELPEQGHWLTVGEGLKNGVMYKDIWDTLAPLAAFTYFLVVGLFGKSVLALNILGMFLNFFLAVILNDLANRNKIFEQNTYLPAFVFILLSSMHNIFSAFSPTQIGTLFVVLALGNLFGHIEFRAKQDEQIMNIGLYLGVAALFYFPLIMFVPIILALFIIFTSTRTRRYFLFILGSLLPLAFAFCYYWVMADESAFFSRNFLLPYFRSDTIVTNWMALITVAIPLLFFLILGIISSQLQRRLTNFQTRLIQLFIVLCLLTPIVLLLTEDVRLELLFILLPVAALLCVHFLLLFRRGLVGEIVALVFALLPIFILFDSARNIIGLFYYEKEQVVEYEHLDIITGKSMMVLGDRPGLYDHGKLGTTFYNWPLSKPFLQELDYYDNLVFIEESIVKWHPEVIVDIDRQWNNIRERLPLVAREFKQVRPGIWVR